MQEHVVGQTVNSRSNKRRPWKVCLGLLGAALLLSLVLGAAAAVNRLVPKVPGHARGATARMGWYLHNDQLQADVRTLGAALEFLMGQEGETPSLVNYSNQPVAAKAAPGSPKS
jgi:hypothetical protein